jgi:hypothetical protein
LARQDGEQTKPISHRPASALRASARRHAIHPCTKLQGILAEANKNIAISKKRLYYILLTAKTMAGRFLETGPDTSFHCVFIDESLTLLAFSNPLKLRQHDWLATTMH